MGSNPVTSIPPVLSSCLVKSPALAVFEEPFKENAAEGAAVELKLRLLAGKVPTLQKYAHQNRLEDIEDELATYFSAALSAAEKETLRLCRQLRNKVLHSDFRAARDKLQQPGVPTAPGDVGRIDLPVVTIEEATRKIAAAKAGTEAGGASPVETGMPKCSFSEKRWLVERMLSAPPMSGVE
jgi:hypothetical protein